MLTTLLYIYLAGWAGFSTYGTYECLTDEAETMKPVPCVATTVAMSAAWPVGVAGYFLLKDMRL